MGTKRQEECQPDNHRLREQELRTVNPDHMARNTTENHFTCDVKTISSWEEELREWVEGE